MLDAPALIQLLGLRPLPVEGGWFAETYRSDRSTAIYYLLTADTCSRMHRLDGDEMYHFYLGDPVELLLLAPGTAGQRVVLGPDLVAGQRVQQLVPRKVWQGSRLIAGGRWALLGTTMAPGFDPRGFSLGARGALVQAFPGHAGLIERLTG